MGDEPHASRAQGLSLKCVWAAGTWWPSTSPILLADRSPGGAWHCQIPGLALPGDGGDVSLL